MSVRATKRDGWEGQQARKLWVELQASEKEVCAQVGITPKTLRKWRDWFGWDEERKNQGASLADLLAGIRARFGQLAQDLEETRPTDAEKLGDVLKLANHLLTTAERIQKLERDVDYKRLALRWAREFSDYLTARDPKALEALAPYLKTFAAEIVRG